MSDATLAFGQKLKAERERRGMSAQKMADDMHLDAWVIDALEAGDHARIGPAVYANGHLKKYASLLGLSAADALSVADTKAATARLPTPVIPMDPGPAGGRWLGPALASFAAVVLAVAVLLWWQPWHLGGSPRSTATVTERETASAPAPATPTPLEAEHSGKGEHAGEADDGHSPQNPALAAAPADAGEPEAGDARTAVAAVDTAAPKAVTVASAPDLTPGVGPARLRLSFSADSRVDVYDYTGRMIFRGDGRANSVKTIAGIAPFRVYLGFASGVQLEVNDRAVAIGPQFVTGDVARFEAGADGVLRRDSRNTNGTQAVAASPRG